MIVIGNVSSQNYLGMRIDLDMNLTAATGLFAVNLSCPIWMFFFIFGHASGMLV